MGGPGLGMYMTQMNLTSRLDNWVEPIKNWVLEQSMIMKWQVILP